jgi:carbon-monoxide dehydrogenase large subunit
MLDQMVTQTEIGAPRRRYEDHRLLTGGGQYVDDLLQTTPGTVHVAFVRSPYAHARIAAIDCALARSAPGVVAVVTAQDLADLSPMSVGGAALGAVAPRRVLPPTHAHFVGEPIGAVVAETAAQADDALELVEVEYDPLPAVASLHAAADADAPLADLAQPERSNVVFHRQQISGDVEEAFARADGVVRLSLTHARVAGIPIEPRGILATIDPDTRRLTIHLSTQAPFRARSELARILRLDPDQLHVIAPDVGGGFGVKGSLQPEEITVAFLARKLNRPVLWRSTRTEDLLTTPPGRDLQTEVEAAYANDGTVLGLRLSTRANVGAYAASPGPATRLLHYPTGCYRIEHLQSDIDFVVTNTPPTGAYRGAGRPEAAFVAERVADEVAAALHLDPVEVRRRNFIPSDAFPYRNAGGIVYDSGNYAGCMDRALELADYAGLRREQAQRRSQGEIVGIGLATYTEIAGGGWEEGQVEVHSDGRVVAHTGSSAHGQGHRTTFAQIVADVLGVDVDAVSIVAGDTDSPIQGFGTFGSRSTVMGGNALFVAGDTVRERLLRVAASMLEVAADDLEIRRGQVFVRGAEHRRTDFASIAEAAGAGVGLAADEARNLRAATRFTSVDGETFPFGACVALISIGRETARVRLERLILVDDCGRVINPLLVDGQLAGGVVQGIGEALSEQVVFSAEAQLMTGSLLDYAVPRARDVPPLELDRTETLSPRNPLGVKGVGEAGTIGSPAAIANAVVDALRPLGVSNVALPITSDQVWSALRGERV